MSLWIGSRGLGHLFLCLSCVKMGVQFVRARIGDSLGVDGVVVVADGPSVAVDHAAQVLKRPVARIPQTLTVALNNSRTLLAVAILLPISDNICGADRVTAAEGVTEIGQVAITGERSLLKFVID